MAFMKTQEPKSNIRLRKVQFASVYVLALGFITTGYAASLTVEEANLAYMECIFMNAHQLDDGKIAPRTLAEQIVPLCHEAHELAVQTTMPDKWNATSLERQKDVELDHTWATVLFYRDKIKSIHP
jgi:hypothetical protein